MSIMLRRAILLIICGLSFEALHAAVPIRSLPQETSLAIKRLVEGSTNDLGQIGMTCRECGKSLFSREPKRVIYQSQVQTRSGRQYRTVNIRCPHLSCDTKHRFVDSTEAPQSSVSVGGTEEAAVLKVARASRQNKAGEVPQLFTETKVITLPDQRLMWADYRYTIKATKPQKPSSVELDQVTYRREKTVGGEVESISEAEARRWVKPDRVSVKTTRELTFQPPGRSGARFVLDGPEVVQYTDMYHQNVYIRAEGQDLPLISNNSDTQEFYETLLRLFRGEARAGDDIFRLRCGNTRCGEVIFKGERGDILYQNVLVTSQNHYVDHHLLCPYCKSMPDVHTSMLTSDRKSVVHSSKRPRKFGKVQQLQQKGIIALGDRRFVIAIHPYQITKMQGSTARVKSEPRQYRLVSSEGVVDTTIEEVRTLGVTAPKTAKSPSFTVTPLPSENIFQLPDRINLKIIPQ